MSNNISIARLRTVKTCRLAYNDVVFLWPGLIQSIQFSSAADNCGDPHVNTLDGVKFTFNGHGEYHVLRVAGPYFNLQGRMQPLVNCDGSITHATVYKAFAMKENGSDVLQVIYHEASFFK